MKINELLKDESISYKEIANRLGVCKSTIYKYAKELGYKRKLGRKKINFERLK